MISDVFKYPRVKLVSLPTPLEKADKLSRELGVNLYIKRDDVMELALGGNKVRKLEFILADALAKNCDVVITRGSVLSNHVRLTAAAARKLGLDIYAVLTPPGEPRLQGNVLLDSIYGAKLIYVEKREEADKVMEELAEKLKKNGRRPYIIPLGGSCELGVLGYALAATEILQQTLQLGFKPDFVVHATGTGTTQAGLIIGFKLLGVGNVKVVGISDGTRRDVLVEKTTTLVNSTARMLGLELKMKSDEVEVYDEYGFGGYGVVSREVVETILHVARLEGVLLDPVYTGKAMYGLVDLVNKGVIKGRVVFVHTGGAPILFQYAEEISKYMDKPWVYRGLFEQAELGSRH